MSIIQEKFIDIRSNGRGVIGRVYNQIDRQPEMVFRGPSRKAMLRKFRSKYNPNPSIPMNRRGETHF